MIRLIMLAVSAAALSASAAGAQMNNVDLKWGPAPPSLPAGAQAAVLSGDPTKEGMFTIRLKFPANYAVAPHHHPTPELVTVIEGSMGIGMGEVADKAKAASLAVGGYVALDANMNHYAFTETGVTIQVTSHGPFQVVYANPADDPRNAAKAPEGGR